MSAITGNWLPIVAVSALVIAFSPTAAQARPDGVAHGGGTNAATARRLTLQELRGLAGEIKILIVPVLNYQEQMARGRNYPLTMRTSRLQNNFRISGKLLHSVQSRLFPANARDVFKELANIEFKLKENGPCRDLQFNDKDATAFNENPGEICLSAKRLLMKLTTANVMTELLAVAGHELAHRMGANEDEALEFQKVIRHTQLAGSAGEYTWRVSRIITDNAPIFRNPSVSALSAEGAAANPFAFCTDINRLYLEANDFITGQYSSLGASAVRFRNLHALEEAGLLLGELSLHCAQVSRNEVPLRDTRPDISRLQKLINIARDL